MTLPYLPGWGDVLQQTLPQIGQGLTDILNPRNKEQAAARQGIATGQIDPQTLANMPPELLQNVLGKGPLAQQIGAIGPDPNRQLKTEVARAGLEAIRDPSQRQDIAGVQLGIGTQAQRRREASELRVAEGTEAARTRIPQQQAEQNQIVLDNLSQEQARKAQALQSLPLLQNMDLNKIAYKISAGMTLTPEEKLATDAAYADPITKAKLDDYLASQRELGRIGAQMKLHMLERQAPQLKAATLGYLQDNINSLGNRWIQSAKLANADQTTIMQLQAQAKSKDQAIATEAKNQLNAINAAKKESGQLQSQMKQAQASYDEVLRGVLGSMGITVPEMPKVSPIKAEEAIARIESGGASVGDLFTWEATGEISEQEANKARAYFAGNKSTGPVDLGKQVPEQNWLGGLFKGIGERTEKIISNPNRTAERIGASIFGGPSQQR